MSEPTLVLGHQVEGRIGHFPHRCPGGGCVIGAWLSHTATRTQAADPTTWVDVAVFPPLEVRRPNMPRATGDVVAFL